jgi:DNA-binding NtrC family response regulator
MKVSGRVLIIGDDVDETSAIECLLRGKGYQVETGHGTDAGWQLLGRFDPDVVITDLVGSLEFLAKVKEMRPETRVIVTTAHGTLREAVQAMKLGAEDYLSKPVDAEELQRVVQWTLARKGLLAETRNRHRETAGRAALDEIVGESPEILEVSKTIRQVAPCTASVLLLGESGTGKELFARALHEGGPRRARPFVKVACAALPETLLESELFGHEKGSFTGALYTRPGRFEAADGGTLFLDEIGDISATVQVKLLRFFEQREFERVGGNKTFKVDVRIVVATHRDLEKRIAEGAFREDLYYRLNVIQIRIPPLRERGNDIALLAHQFMLKYAQANGKDIRSISDAVVGALLRHPWPGNVRELENMVERAVVLADGPTLTEPEFPTLHAADTSWHDAARSRLRIPGDTLADIERAAILRALAASSGSTSKAAAMLGVSTRKLQYKQKEYRAAGESHPSARPRAVVALWPGARGARQ